MKISGTQSFTSSVNKNKSFREVLPTKNDMHCCVLFYNEKTDNYFKTLQNLFKTVWRRYPD